ncbi:MAG: hypothetical protein JXA60_02370 [Candidatus Coatesbacteria bacterium]|nr:hypothetical protein [Candidatus Coatesbacteria bacterium]
MDVCFIYNGSEKKLECAEYAWSNIANRAGLNYHMKPFSGTFLSFCYGNKPENISNSYLWMPSCSNCFENETKLELAGNLTSSFANEEIPIFSEIHEVTGEIIGSIKTKTESNIVPVLSRKSYNGLECIFAGFDLLNAVFSLLTFKNEETSNNDVLKRHDTMKHILIKSNMKEMPVIDIYAELMKKLFWNLAKSRSSVFLIKGMYPGNQKGALIITHDVDRMGYIYKQPSYLQLKRITKALLKKEVFSFNELISSIRNPLKDPYWKIDEILGWEKEKGIKADYFFLANPSDPFCYRYDIRKPELGNKINEVISRNHSVGLHSSIEAFSSLEQLIMEKEMLERICNKKISKVRQHYLLFDYGKSPERFKEAGLNIDAGISFHDETGFRAGTSYPFKYFNHNQITAFPLSLMDGALLFKKDIDHWDDFIRLFNSIYKMNGIHHWLIHPRTWFEDEFKGWKEFFKKAFEFAYSKQLWQVTLDELVNWLENRNLVRMSHLSTKPDRWFILNTCNEKIQMTFNVLSQNEFTIELYRNQESKPFTRERNFQLELNAGEEIIIVAKIGKSLNA